MEKIIKKTKLYKGKIVELNRLLVELPNGKLGFREVINHHNGVCIIPIKDDKIFFVKQYRIAINQEIIELPAGLVEENEKNDVAALRELSEEIKYSSKKIKYLGTYYCTPGCMDEATSIFLADDLFPLYKDEDEDENIEIVTHTISEAKKMLENCEFIDMKTALGLSLYFNTLTTK